MSESERVRERERERAGDSSGVALIRTDALIGHDAITNADTPWGIDSALMPHTHLLELAQCRRVTLTCLGCIYFRIKVFTNGGNHPNWRKTIRISIKPTHNHMHTMLLYSRSLDITLATGVCAYSDSVYA